VIIGYDYDARIDIWSVGAVLAELHTGYVLFQNDSVPTMLSRITGILGPFPNHVLEASRETGKYFSLSNIVFERDEEGSFNLIFPKKTNLHSRLHLAAPNDLATSTDDALFLDFVRQMLHLDPAKRMTAAEALAHPWLADADSIYVKEYIIGETNNNAPKQHAPSTANGSADMSDEFDDAEYEEDAVAEAQEEAALEYAYFMSNHPQDASTVDAYLRYLQEKRQNFFEDEDEDDEYSDAPNDHNVDGDEGNDDDEDEGNDDDEDEGNDDEEDEGNDDEEDEGNDDDEDEGNGNDEDEGDDDGEDEVDDDGEDVPQEKGVSVSAIEGLSGARDLADDLYPREA
jgi:serine/threonine protein kinase